MGAGLGGGRGSAGVPTSVADSFLRAGWHSGMHEWVFISEHMSKTFSANENSYSCGAPQGAAVVYTPLEARGLIVLQQRFSLPSFFYILF